MPWKSEIDVDSTGAMMVSVAIDQVGEEKGLLVVYVESTTGDEA